MILNIKRRGKSQYNPIYEFPYTLNGSKLLMVFTSVIGHLLNMDFPKEYKSWTGTTPLKLFDTSVPIEIEVEDKKDAIAKTLIEEASKAHGLILWLDCDREGENIGFEVIRMCKKGNSRLSIKSNSSLVNNIRRARFSDLTPQAIYHAISNLVFPNEKESDAVDARREIDLRLGAAFTRFQTVYLQQKFDGLPEEPISYGSCQFPTLGFVVRRFQKNQEFIPENFWKVVVSYSSGSDTVHFTWKRGQLFDRSSAIIFLEICLDTGILIIDKIEKKSTSKWKPLPLNTVELQKLAATHLKFTATQTMTIAEELYNKSFISYPRTETDSFQISDSDLQNLIQIQTSDSQWGNFARELIQNNKYQRPRAGKNNDNAHPPIHPVKYPDENLGTQQKQLYELITRHFLACTSRDAQGFQTTINGSMSSEEFVCNGLMITERNFLDVYPYIKWNNKNIPVFTEGQRITPSSITLQEGQTTAPPLLTETALISLMNKNGIGTDATIAEHIDKIQKRMYAKKVGNVFEPTSLGLSLVEAYTAMKLDLTRPEMRALMESDMNKICHGQLRKDQVIEQTLNMYRGVFVEANSKVTIFDTIMIKYFNRLGEGRSNLIKDKISKCGACGSMMSLRSTTNCKFLKCLTCNLTFNIPRTGDPKPIETNCQYCGFQVLKIMKPNKDKGYNICPNCYNTPPDIEESTGSMPCFQCSNSQCPLSGSKKPKILFPCPSCSNQGMALKQRKDGGFFIGCTSFGKNDSCSNVIWAPRRIQKIEIGPPCQNCGTNGKVVNMIQIQESNSTSTVCLLCDRSLRSDPDWGFTQFGRTQVPSSTFTTNQRQSNKRPFSSTSTPFR